MTHIDTSIQFSIKKLTNRNSQAAIDLVLAIQRIEFNIPITLEDQPDLLDIDGSYTNCGGGFWGAFYGEQLVGTIAMLNVGHGTGVIRKMFVKKEFRGKEIGIANELMNSLIVFSKESDLSNLYLGTINILKAAQRFYERNGFCRIEKQELPEYFPLMKNDDVFFKLIL